MNKLIIDQSVKRYQPQVVFTELNDDVDLRKFNKIYVYITNKNQIKLRYNNIIYITDKDMIIDDPDIIVVKQSYTPPSTDFKKKIIHHEYIYDYLFK